MTPVPILFCITDLDPGGAERAMTQIVLRLPRDEWSPTVVSLSHSGELVSTLERAHVPVYCLGARHARDPRVLPRLIGVMKQTSPKIVQTFLYHANIVGRLAAAWARVPYVVSGIRVAERRSRWPLRIDRWTQRWVTTNVCVSRAVADFTQKQAGISCEKLQVIPNGVDVQRFSDAEPIESQDLGVPPGVKPLICIGRLDPQKGHHVLFDAIAQLKPSDPTLHLLVVGRGPLEQELISHVARRSLSDRIHFMGWRDDVSRLLKSSSIFVLSSHWEGMPNVILEAMAAGLPIISTDVEGVRELVIPERNGLIVPVGQSEPFAAAIANLRAAPDVATRMGCESQALVIKDYAIGSVVHRYRELYTRLISAAR